MQPADVWPSFGLKVPSEHASHESGEVRPTASEKRPRGHASHDDRPVPCEMCIRDSSRQELREAKRPAAQGSHAPEAVLWTSPEPQREEGSMQPESEVEPEVLVVRPGGQGEH